MFTSDVEACTPNKVCNNKSHKIKVLYKININDDILTIPTWDIILTITKSLCLNLTIFFLPHGIYVCVCACVLYRRINITELQWPYNGATVELRLLQLTKQ